MSRPISTKEQKTSHNSHMAEFFSYKTLSKNSAMWRNVGQNFCCIFSVRHKKRPSLIFIITGLIYDKYIYCFNKRDSGQEKIAINNPTNNTNNEHTPAAILSVS